MNPELEKLLNNINNLKQELLKVGEELKNNKKVDTEKDLAIIINKIKNTDSIKVRDRFLFNYSTNKCKDILIDLGGVYVEDDEYWLFKGVAKEDKTVQEDSEFIVNRLKKEGYELFIRYEEWNI